MSGNNGKQLRAHTNAIESFRDDLGQRRFYEDFGSCMHKPRRLSPQITRVRRRANNSVEIVGSSAERKINSHYLK